MNAANGFASDLGVIIDIRAHTEPERGQVVKLWEERGALVGLAECARAEAR